MEDIAAVSRQPGFLAFLIVQRQQPLIALMEYRLTAHTFGNGLSPAVATFGLIRTVDDGVESCHEVKEFITRNFNVDGGLVLKPAAEVVVTLMRSL